MELLESYGVIVPPSGESIALVGMFPDMDYNRPKDLVFKTPSEWAQAFDRSVDDDHPLRVSDWLQYGGSIFDGRLQPESVIERLVGHERPLAATTQDLVDADKFYLAETHLTSTDRSVGTLWWKFGPFPSGTEARKWAESLVEGMEKRELATVAEHFRPVHIGRAEILSLSPRARSVAASWLEPESASAHPSACTVCFKVKRWWQSSNDGTWVAMLLHGSIRRDRYRLVGPFASRAQCEKWCLHFNRLERDHGGRAHAMPVSTQPYGYDFEEWMEPGDVGGRTPEDAARFAEGLYDPAGDTVLFHDLEGRSDDGDFMLYGPFRRADAAKYISTLPFGQEGGAVDELQNVRALLSPGALFQLAGK